MALVTDFAILATINYVNYTGQSSNSLGSQDLNFIFENPLQLPMQKLADFNTTINIKLPLNAYYKMKGWNPLTQQYEDWHSEGTPLLDPPSGNALEHISIVRNWKDR